MPKDETRKVDRDFLELFCKKIPFSENITKYEDDVVFDMYDHNCFILERNVTLRELFDAQAYQHKKKCDFLKLESFHKLKKDLVKRMGLEENVYLTMLFKGKKESFKINEKIVIKNISLKELDEIEIKHYGKAFGEGFIRRRDRAYVRERKRNQDFNIYGAYLNGKNVGYCYAYTSGAYTCIDSLLVDRHYRHRNIASTLIRYVIERSDRVMLHADEDDYPKEIYLKYGFRIVDRTYEYFKPLKKINDEITVMIDRPMGTWHPEGKNIFYEINYGYVKGLIAPDLEEQDVYVLDENKPCKKAKGRIIAILHRLDDMEDKWVIGSRGHSLEDIEKSVEFQEKYHTHITIM